MDKEGGREDGKRWGRWRESALAMNVMEDIRVNHVIRGRYRRSPRSAQ